MGSKVTQYIADAESQNCSDDILGCYKGTLFAQRNTTRDTTATPLPAAVAVENEVSIVANRV